MPRPDRLLAPLLFALLLGDAHTAQTPQRYLAVVIGVTGYPAYPPVKKLKYADADARLFNDYLRSPDGLAIPSQNIRLLLNGQARRDSVQDALSWLRSEARRSDVVFFFFAGHGEVDERIQGYLMPYEGDPVDPARRGIPTEDIISRLAALPAHVFAYIDACHAGAAGSSLARGGALNVVSPIRTVWTRQTSQAEAPIRMGLMSARQNQASYEADSLGHGLFTWYLLAGLRGQADGTNGARLDGELTVAEVFAYVEQNVQREALRRFGDNQTPMPIGEYQGGFVLGLTAQSTGPARSFTAHEWFVRAEAARHAGRHREAVDEYRRAVETDSLFASAYFGLGYSLTSLADTSGALAAYRTAIRLNPSDADARNNLGHLLMIRNDVRGAESEFREALRLRPNESLYLNNLGAARQELGDADSALVLYREAIRLHRGNALAHRNSGTVLLGLRDLPGASRELQEAVRLDPADALAAALVREASDSISALENRVARARDSVSRVPAAWKYLSFLLHEDAFDFPGSLALLLEHQRLTPNDTVIRVELAESYFTSGRFADAGGLLSWVLANPGLPARYRIAMQAIAVANAYAQGQQAAADAGTRNLTTLIRTQPDSFDLNWIFTGAKFFIRTEPRLAPQRRWLVQLFTALERGRRDSILARLPSEAAVAQLTWIRCENNSWCGLNLLNLSDAHFDDMAGVYVVWVGGKQVLWAGRGFIRDELRRLRGDPTTQSYASMGVLLVTWARAPVDQQDGITRFLTGYTHPTLSPVAPSVPSVPATPPW